MFFGSGNLVFPLLVGQESGGHYLLASLGIIFTGVMVPFLGLLGVMLCGGSLKEFFSPLGKMATFIFSFIALSLMGPFGVLARCFTVAHGAIQTIFPVVPLAVTSFCFCALIYLMTIKKNKIVSTLGSYLTPLLLISIGAIAFFAFKETSVDAVSAAVADVSAWSSFKNGFLQGYQTMDLLAAFFFSAFIINHLQSVRAEDASEKSSLKIFLRSSYVGGGLLAVVYFVLVVLGSLYAPSLSGLLPQDMLGHIALKTLGSLGAPCLCLVVVLACLTTAVVLTSLFADFLRKEVLKEKIGNSHALLITLGIGFLVSILGFSAIARFLGPVLELIYPALIVLTVVNISHKFFGVKNSHWPVTLTLAAKIYMG